MNFELKDRIAIVGGSSKGLGKACAISLAKEGAKIVLCANDSASLEKTKQEIEAIGVSVLALLVDMSLEIDNERIIKETILEFGRIDILINNSGGPKPGSFYDISNNDWDDAYNSVLKYNVRMIKGCLPYMEKLGWGRIINITSLAVKEPAKTLVLSNVFRAGVVSLAKSLSKDLISKGITINNICPGAFKTDRAKELMQKRADESGSTVDEIEEQTVRNFPQKRYQHPEELGDLVCFLASERAAAITGTTIQIDGGISNSLL
ncbi:MAG: SDR family oxidoreductase [Bacteroidia bacterium]|nr:SDR family oxidoreductase [Bacteroidia bacterium]